MPPKTRRPTRGPANKRRKTSVIHSGQARAEVRLSWQWISLVISTAYLAKCPWALQAGAELSRLRKFRMAFWVLMQLHLTKLQIEGQCSWHECLEYSNRLCYFLIQSWRSCHLTLGLDTHLQKCLIHCRTCQKMWVISWAQKTRKKTSLAMVVVGQIIKRESRYILRNIFLTLPFVW